MSEELSQHNLQYKHFPLRYYNHFVVDITKHLGVVSSYGTHTAASQKFLNTLYFSFILLPKMIYNLKI